MDSDPNAGSLGGERPTAVSEVALEQRPVELLQRLIRFDTSNPPGGERACIEWAQRLLEAGGCIVRIVAQDPVRPNLIARLRGDGGAPALLLQGHVDVVPVEGSWSRPPFGGDLADGYVWGRGARERGGAASESKTTDEEAS